MQVAVVTFDGFNELDSFIASALINRCRKLGLQAFITAGVPEGELPSIVRAAESTLLRRLPHLMSIMACRETPT